LAALDAAISDAAHLGYSRRHDKDDPITPALASVMDEFGWSRFAMRLSDAPGDSPSAIVVPLPNKRRQMRPYADKKPE